VSLRKTGSTPPPKDLARGKETLRSSMGATHGGGGDINPLLNSKRRLKCILQPKPFTVARSCVICREVLQHGLSIAHNTLKEVLFAYTRSLDFY